jgi:membrane protease YdiL (CAAX protease family)
MRVRDIFFSGERLRALWRVLLFLALTVGAVWGVGRLAALLPLPSNGAWGLGLNSLVLTVGVLVASAVMMRVIERRPLAALGLPLGQETGRGLLVGAAIGGAYMVVVIVAQTLIGWLRPAPDAGTLVDWFEMVGGLALFFLVAAAAEELLLRGYAFQVLVEGMGMAVAVLVTSALFALGHLWNPNIDAIALVNIGLAGVILAGAYLRTRSLWVAIGLHWAWNWVMAAVFDLPVSGIRFDVPGYDTMELGPDTLTGGVFGPEAGLVVTLLALPLIVWIYRTSWLRESQRMAELRPLVDSRDLP